MPPRKVGKRLTARRGRTSCAGGSGRALPTLATGPTSSRRARHSLPSATGAWPINPVDVFLLSRLEKEGLRPTARLDAGPPLAAARASLLRRLSLDLTGLPPTLTEGDAFLQDASPDAYEKVVDSLLASPAFGERWAVPWLDLGRYADSQGYANDPDRTIWPWRDWVIQALNDNLPYDRFTTEQLAGDLFASSGR